MRRNVHRGIVALAIVTSLSFAGARPAAAANLGFLDQLSHLWMVLTGSPGPAPHRPAGRSHGIPAKATSTPTSDRGWGIDPNGHTVTADPNVPSTNG